MQKFDHRNLIYWAIGIQERVEVKEGKRDIRVRAIEVLLYDEAIVKKRSVELEDVGDWGVGAGGGGQLQVRELKFVVVFFTCVLVSDLTHSGERPQSIH